MRGRWIIIMVDSFSPHSTSHPLHIFFSRPLLIFLSPSLPLSTSPPLTLSFSNPLLLSPSPSLPPPPDLEEVPVAEDGEQSESILSDSDDCIVPGQSSMGRKVGEPGIEDRTQPVCLVLSESIEDRSTVQLDRKYCIKVIGLVVFISWEYNSSIQVKVLPNKSSLL